MISINSPGRPLPALRRHNGSSAAAGLWLFLVLAGVLCVPGITAAASGADDYTNAIHRALTLVQFAERGDLPSRSQAITVLVESGGDPQPEILADLRADPPRLVDADQRLQALFNALQARVGTPDPGRADEHLRQVLSLPRYSSLTSGPSIPQLILAALLSALRWLLSWLGLGNLHLHLPILLLLALSLFTIVALVILTLRVGLSPGGRQAKIRAATAAHPLPVDFFKEADRLAASGDYRGAIRMLAGGVAVRISGEHAWDRSPFTVRELFARSRGADSLRPLLLTFEEAIYGHRAADAGTYARAAQAAAPYRQGVA